MLLNRLRRITTGGRWIPEIDGLRFVAIFSVLLYHLSGELGTRSGRIIPVEPKYAWLGALLSYGDRGVVLFFVISGLILGLPFARHCLSAGSPVRLGKYYMRRVTRLEPPYILAILLASLMIEVYSHPSGVAFWGHVLATIFYQHNLIYATLSPVSAVTWSLEIEIQFYVLAPLFMLVYRISSRLYRRASILVAILAFGLAQWPFSTSPRFELSILFFVQYFLAGLLLADIFVLDLDRMRRSYAWDLAGVVSMAILFTAPKLNFWSHILLPFVLVVLILSAMRGRLLRSCFSNSVIAVTGGMCYSIYLMHYICIAAIFKLTRHAIIATASFPINMAIQFLVTGLPAIALSLIFYLLVERPCMDPEWPAKLRRYLSRSSGRLDSNTTAQ